jgi:hypothetical protein
MTKTLIKKQLVGLPITINLFHLALWAYAATQKVGPDYDEYYSFVHANKYVEPTFRYPDPIEPFYHLTDGQTYLMSDLEGWDAVDRECSFDFSIPYNNVVAMGSSHPPLYHILLHFTYSFFPKLSSIWPALIINFLALTLAAYSVFFIAREIWAYDMAALFAMTVFGTMYGVVNMAVFLRAYSITMMWAGWLVFWHLREKKNHLLLVPLVFFGAMSHFYFFVFLLLTAFYYGIGLLAKKKWGDVWLYIGSMLIAAGLYLLAFPYVFSQIADETDRVAQAFDQIQSSFGRFGRDLISFTDLLGESVCAETPLLLLGALALIAALAWHCVKRRKFPPEKAKPFLVVAIPALLSLFAIVRIAIHPAYKYISFLLPSMCIIFWGLLYQAIKLAWGNKRGLTLTVLVFCLLLDARRLIYLPKYCYQDELAYRYLYPIRLPENNNVAVLCLYETEKAFLVINYQSLREAKYFQLVNYNNLDLYTGFPEDGDIILLMGDNCQTRGREQT